MKEERETEMETESVHVCVGACVRDETAILNWMKCECLTKGTTFEKGEEASFVDVWVRAFLA